MNLPVAGVVHQPEIRGSWQYSGRWRQVASDKTRYVTRGTVAGAPEGHCAPMLCQAAYKVRCREFVQGQEFLNTSGRVHLSHVKRGLF